MEEKKYVWVLCEDRNVPRGDEDDMYAQLKSVWVYSSFETARQEMRDLIRSHAVSDNGLFDGDGRIIKLREYVENSVDGCGDIFDPYEKDNILSLTEKLRAHFLGEAAKIPDFEWTDWFVGCTFESDTDIGPTLQICGVDDGPCNGINPYIHMNTFEMEDPDRNYIWRVHDTFDEFERENHVEISILKVGIDDMVKDDILPPAKDEDMTEHFRRSFWDDIRKGVAEEDRD